MANRLTIGYLPEERGLYPKEKVSEQLIYFARLEEMHRIGVIKSLKYWLERLGIKEYEHNLLISTIGVCWISAKYIRPVFCCMGKSRPQN